MAEGKSIGCSPRALVLALIVAARFAAPAQAAQTVNLSTRQFATSSPAAPFQSFFSEARRLAASTTVAWKGADTDLTAWGPALIFPLLEPSTPRDAILDLAATLEEPAAGPILLFRTAGLYAAKSRLPFVDTPTLMSALGRNLGLIERATRDIEGFTAAAGLRDWGSIGTGAWLAYLELLYRDYGDLGAPGASPWNAEGLRIVEQLVTQGQLADGKGFRRGPHDDQLSLWPSTLMIYALMQAYENEEAVKYESSAIAAAAAIELLRAGDGSYFSTPAKAETDARANTYLAGALLLLAKNTGDRLYRERAVGIIQWLSSGQGATAVGRDAGLGAHVAYLVLLLDSLATQPYENLLGRRPMRVAVESAVPAARSVADMAARLRPDDFRYRGMFDAVLHTLVERVPHAAGDFAYDYGDAPGYAASVLLNAGDTTIAPQIVRREERLLSWPRPRNFDEIAFGTRALFAALDHDTVVDSGAAGSALRRYLWLSGGLAFADRYYLDWLDWYTGGGGYDYGPTVLGAQIASTHLEYAERFPTQRVGWWQPVQIARALIDGANTAWDADRQIYRARPNSDEIWVLPNAMMILDLLRAHQLTGEPAYRARAEAVGRGLDALWDEQRGAYFASSGQMGDLGYESLSTNSYAALAFLRLYETTHTPAYRSRAAAVFEFIGRDLYADGVVYHHVYRGRRAAGDIWCVGCNWRVLAELTELAAVR